MEEDVIPLLALGQGKRLGRSCSAKEDGGLINLTDTEDWFCWSHQHDLRVVEVGF